MKCPNVEMGRFSGGNVAFKVQLTTINHILHNACDHTEQHSFLPGRRHEE